MVNRKRKKDAAAVAIAGGQRRTRNSVVAEEEKNEKDYEKIREERIKENLERIHKLGIMDLSLHFRSQCTPTSAATTSPSAGRRPKAHFHQDHHGPLPLPLPPLPAPPRRRSSRLQNVDPVSYAEVSVKKNENETSSGLSLVEEGEREEVYTDEHAALLGSCDTSWTLFVDGYDKDGRRIYDQVNGKTCHQCRQKTLGHHTHCSKCNLVQGQFCGDCLYMRYGEHVLEVKKNADWICPACRGICNCSICRTKKGWPPTGALYQKVIRLGFKSVAHYLIQTRQRQSNCGQQISSQIASSSMAPELLNNADLEHNILDSKIGLNSEIADKDPSDPQTKLYIINSGANLDSTEEDSKDFSHKIKPPCPEEHTPGNKSRKEKEPGAVEKLRADSIASRLRKRVRSTTG